MVVIIEYLIVIGQHMNGSRFFCEYNKCLCSDLKEGISFFVNSEFITILS